MKAQELESVGRVIRALASHFGPNTEIVLHDLTTEDLNHSIIAIENGHVSGRKIGDGPSHIVLEALSSEDPAGLEDRISYLTRTENGKTLKSTTIFLHDQNGRMTAVLGINTDITLTLAMENALHAMHTTGSGDAEPEPITSNVADLLDTLIARSMDLIGKPASLMSRDEKIRALTYLDENGAFLVTKSGPKVCNAFGISKYTLYSYLDEIRSGKA